MTVSRPKRRVAGIMISITLSLHLKTPATSLTSSSSQQLCRRFSLVQVFTRFLSFRYGMDDITCCVFTFLLLVLICLQVHTGSYQMGTVQFHHCSVFDLVSVLDIVLDSLLVLFLLGLEMYSLSMPSLKINLTVT